MPDRLSKKFADALASGQAKWDATVSEYDGPIEIRATDFVDIRLQELHVRNTTFAGCKFDLVTFKGVEFSNTSFIDCTFVRSAFSDVRFVTCDFDDLTLRDSSSKLLSIEGGSLCSVTCTGGGYSSLNMRNVLLQEANFLDCQIFSCEIIESRINKLRATGVTSNTFVMQAVEGRSISLSDCNIESYRLAVSNVSELTMNSAEIRDLKLEDSTIYDLQILDSHLLSIDLSRSSIFDSDLTTFAIERAVLSKSSFRRCAWPDQHGTTRWFGGFKAAKRLLDHPVHEIEGLEPQLSGEISQGQLLSRLSEASKKNFLRRLSFLLWGFLTDYGRSLSRFGVYCLLSVCVFSFLQMAECVPWQQMDALEILSQFVESWKYKAQVFLGFPVEQNATTCRTSYDFPMRLVGFISIGLWVGLAANRLGFLSAVNK